MQEINKKFTADEQSRLGRRLLAKRKNARGRGIECTLTMEDIFMLGFKLLGNGTCDYTNLAFSTIIAGENGDPSHPRYPTIERIDDTKGYIRGNVCVVMQRANQLKDNLVDKKIATTISEPIDREIVKALMLNMSKGHMEMLKTKYIPKKEKEMKIDDVMQNSDNNIPDNNIPDNNTSVTTDEKGEMGTQEVGNWEHPEHGVTDEEKTSDDPVVEEKQKLPDDVAIAKAYARYCTDFDAVGMNVSVSFAQFKSKYLRKTCALTGEELTSDQKFILVLDLKIGFAKDNFIVVGSKIGNAITTMMISTGFSVPRIWGMLNKVVG